MSTWTTPATFVTGAVTAASMNAEIRDHANFLKGSLDVLTGSTTADTGDTMSLYIKRASTGVSAFQSTVTADVVVRFNINADGEMSWGAGAVARDATIKRRGASTLQTLDTAFSARRAASTSIALQATVEADTVGRLNVLASGALQFSDGAAAADVQMSRSAAGILVVDTNSGALTTRLRVQSTAGQTNGVDLLVAGDVAARALLSGDATNTGLFLGPGTSTALKVVGARVTGYGAFTGTLNRATAYATGTVTLVQLAERVGALQADLTTHGLIGA